MPTVKSRKYPDNVQFIDSQAWELMQEKGLSRRYIVIDDSDMADTVVGTPEKIIDFADTDMPQPEDIIEKVLSRDEIKEELDNIEVEYNTRASTDKLLELLNQNK